MCIGKIPSDISIHVPAWGTTDPELLAVLKPVFQSTFPRGERRANADDTTVYAVYFNPRSRVGNDWCWCWCYCGIIYFNPRSRVGNDNRDRIYHATVKDFNPRSRVGNDVKDCATTLFSSLFQSTFPRGERPKSLFVYDTYYVNFNPRSRVGNDNFLLFHVHVSRISIHVPAWGTTDVIGLLEAMRVNFNPRSRVGNDIFRDQLNIALQNDFNPRSRVGNDLIIHHSKILLIISIHVPAWGTTYIPIIICI